MTRVQAPDGSPRTTRLPRVGSMAVALAFAFILVGEGIAGAESRTADAPPWAVGRGIPYENVEGAIVISFALSMSGLDTTGLALLDTGAGFIAIDRGLVARLAYAVDTTEALSVLPAPLTGVRVGGFAPVTASPALALDLAGIRAATDRAVLALVGASWLREQLLVVDPRSDTLRVIPSPHVEDSSLSARTSLSRERLGGLLGPAAIAVPFELRGDRKIVLRVTLDQRHALRLVLDTGATKLALFRGAVPSSAMRTPGRRRLRGLVAPTVYGDADVQFVRLTELALDEAQQPVRELGVDAAWVDSPLGAALSNTVGEPVHGLLGYSFLRRFRYAIDYGSRVLWLDRADVGVDERPNEYCTVGIQLIRSDARTIVSGVSRPSPAHAAGVRTGDELLSVDGVSTRDLDLRAIAIRLEGEPGSLVRLRWRRGSREIERVLHRERLL